MEMTGASEAQNERERRLNQIYLAIISRYKDYIEEKEGLSVAELPTLVMPSEQRVASKVDEIKASSLNYSYDDNFYSASVDAYNFVRMEIEDTILPLQFWLTPEETLEFMMGDSMDKNILLCSLLIKLGNPSAKVFVKMPESTRKVFVYYEFKDKFYLMDLENNVQEFENRGLMLKRLDIQGETIAYEFNNQMYADIN